MIVIIHYEGGKSQVSTYPRFQVFELSQVAELAGVTPATAKNWVNGRILEITPSAREADGKGSRNLFTEKDVFKFYVANQMNRLGFSPKGAIRKVLERFDENYGDRSLEEIKATPWLILKNTKSSWEVSWRKVPEQACSAGDGELRFSLNLRDLALKAERKR